VLKAFLKVDLLTGI